LRQAFIVMDNTRNRSIISVHRGDVFHKVNGTHQLLAYGCDINVLKHNRNTIKKNMDAIKEVVLEVNTEKPKYMLMSCQRIQDKIIT
jgi:hypothetical protein